MVYSKDPPKSRKYKKSVSSKHHKSHSQHSTNLEEPALPLVETVSAQEKKSPSAFSFLSSLFGPKEERGEKSGKPILNLLDHNIYLDDLLLIGLILLLMTDKIEDEILIIILVYLLLDIF